MDTIVEISDANFAYRERSSRMPTPLLDQFSLSLAEKEIVAMVGPSGCGKSTIARLIAGLLFPTSGVVLFRGEPVEGPSRQRGLIAQGDWCLPWFTVLANVRLGLAESSSPIHVEQLLAAAGLAEFLDRYPAELSFGARQRVCLVRALVAGADILTLDEPLSSVDAVRKVSLEQSIRSTLKAAGVSALWITHDLDEALLVADRIIVVGRRPLVILHEEVVERRSEDIREMVDSAEFQRHRTALQKRVVELWPIERGLPINAGL